MNPPGTPPPTGSALAATAQQAYDAITARMDARPWRRPPETYDEINARMARRLVPDPPRRLRNTPEQQPGGDPRVQFRFPSQREAALAAQVAALQAQVDALTRTYSRALTVAGVSPDPAEIAAAVAGAYSPSSLPREGDIVYLTVSGAPRFRAIVTKNGVASGIWCVLFSLALGVDYYAHVTQTGTY